jgi:hypothetical protein
VFRILFLLASALFQISSATSEIDLIFTPQRSFYSAAHKGMGDAGIALPSGITAGLLNPSLVNVYRKDIKETHGSVSAGFGRDSLYNKLMLPFGVSYSAEDGSAALFYRFLSSDQKLSHHEFTFNLSGMLFPGSEDQGSVDFGTNIRLEMIKWKNRELDPLYMVTRHHDTITHRPDDTIALAVPELLQGELSQTNLILDIGFFQPEVLPNVDFGLTLRNLTGYSWRTVKPFVYSTRDTLNDSTVVDSLLYGNQKQKKGQWIQRKYKTLSAGIVYHAQIKPQSFTLAIPLDLEILGLFDKKIKNRFVFKGGIEALVAGRFALRLGYSRAPGILMKGFSQIKNLNFFTGGGGVKINPVTFDFYVSHNVFGTTLAFDY